MTQFRAEVFQNAYLPQGAREVHAIMTVSAEGVSAPAASPSGKLIGFIFDNSGSMEGGKLHAVKEAMGKLVSLLPEETFFFVIAGAEEGKLIVPIVRATPDNKRRAIAAVQHIQAEGGTCISTWLNKALTQFSSMPDAIRQAVLLTDGENEKEDDEALEAALKSCEGVFQCECRGVGIDWVVSELQRISQRLLGTTDIIPQPAMIATHFQSFLQQALKKEISSVALRLWTPLGAFVRFCKEVSPEIVDLTARGTQVRPQILDFPTGSWARSEVREYHFCVEVKPGVVGDEMLAGRASLVVTTNGVETKVAEARILAIWTDDDSKSTKIDRRVAHYTGQAELAASIQDGLEARARGDHDLATARLGRAVQLAHSSGNEPTAKLLRGIVDVQDAETGTVRLKRQITKEDAMALETRSTKTRRLSTTVEP